MKSEILRRVGLYCGVLSLATIQCSCDRNDKEADAKAGSDNKMEQTELSLANKRLPVMPSAAYFAKDSSAVFATGDIKMFVDQVIKPVLAVNPNCSSDLEKIKLPFNSIAVALNKGFEKISDADMAMQAKETEQMAYDLTTVGLKALNSKVSTGEANIFDLVKSYQRMNSSPKMIASFIKMGEQLDSALVTTVIGYPKDKAGADIQKEWDNQLSQVVTMLNGAGGSNAKLEVKSVDGISWKLLSFDFAQLSKQYAALLTQSNICNQELIEVLSSSKMAIAYRVDGNNVIVELLMNPEKQLGKKVDLANSILSNPSFDMADSVQSGDLYGYLYASSEVCKANNMSQTMSTESFFTGVKKGYADVAKELSWKQAPAMEKSLDTMKEVMVDWLKSIKPEQAMTMCMWKDQGLRIQMKLGVSGVLNEQTPAAFGDLVNTPGALSVCAGGLDPKFKQRIITMTGSAWDLTAATINALPLSSAEPSDLVNYLKKFKQSAPFVVQGGAMVKALINGFGNNGGMVISGDRTDEEIKQLTQMLPSPIAMPKVAMIADVSKRGDIDAVWSQMTGMYKMFGMPMGAPELPMPTTKSEGDLTSYTYDSFGIPAVVNPSVSVSNNLWILSSPATFGPKVASFAKPMNQSPYSFYHSWNLKKSLDYVKKSISLAGPSDASQMMKGKLNRFNKIVELVEEIKMTIQPGKPQQAIYDIHFIAPKK